MYIVERKPKKEDRPESTGWVVVRLIVLVVLALFILMVGIGLANPRKPVDPVEACNREFGAGSERANECKGQLLGEELQQMDRDKMDRVRRETGN